MQLTCGRPAITSIINRHNRLMVDVSWQAFSAHVFARSPYRVMHDKDDGGKIAHYILQWMSTREEVGPWSTPISSTVPAI